MIEITNNTQNEASDFVKTRAKHCSCVKVGNGEYRVSPMTYGFELHRDKTKRRVRFLMMDDRVWAICRDWYDGSPCDANLHGRHCCHVIAALKRFTTSVTRELRRVA